MVVLVLHRTHILKDFVKGYLTIEGTKFSCYTLEACSVEGHKPIRPSLFYSLPVGEYKCRLSTFSLYPLVPQIIADGYKRIGFVEQTSPIIMPGCVALGTNFLTERWLSGWVDVYNAMRGIITSDFEKWRKDIILKIVNDGDIVRVSDGTYEEDGEDDMDYNFVNL